jgi:hypothetical protein
LQHRQPERSAHLLIVGAISLALTLVSPCSGSHAQSERPEVVSRSLAGTEASTILGRGVVDSTGDDVGPLVDVLVDKDGKPVAGVIDVGGFFGVGRRRVAVAWRLLRFEPGSGETPVHLDLTLDSAAAAPEYLGPDNTLIVIDRPPP